VTGLTASNEKSASREHGHRRGGRGLAARLSRTTALLSGALLLIVGVVLTVVSYNAQLEQLIIRQQKTADEAALVASTYFVRAQDMLWTYGQASSVHSLLLRSLEIQQEQLESIISQYPDVFQELTLLDDQGKELARVSSSYTYPARELGSWAGSPALERTAQGEMYVAGQVRVPTSGGYPAIVMAVPLQQQYGRSGTLAADVSVKGMWDAIAGVEVGETGYSYIVDRNTGEIMAHSDLNRFLALEGQSLERVPIVRRVMTVQESVPSEMETLPNRYMGLSDETVIGAVAYFANTPWAMIVELPVDEAMASVRQMILLLALLVVLGVLAAAALGLVIPRRLVGPLLDIQRGAQALGAGSLDHAIDVRTGDELQDLAESFNQMAANLHASREELERRGAELETRVAERTRELTEISARTERRALQLQTGAEVARAIASVRDLDELLPRIVETISQRFGWYHAGIFLLEEGPSLAGDAWGHPALVPPLSRRTGSEGKDSVRGRAERSNKLAVLHAASSEGGRRMIARGHRLRVGEQGIVGTVAALGQARIALDVGQDAAYFDTPELHGTHSEMALPLRAHPAGRQDSAGDPPEVIGVLDIQSLKPGAYDDEDLVLLSSLADQVAIAIENARLFRETQRMLEEVRALHRQVVEQEWDRIVATRDQEDLVYDFRRPGAPPQPDPWPSELLAALHQGQLVAVPGAWEQEEQIPASSGGEISHSALAAPIKLRDQVIGGLELQDIDPNRRWTADEIALVQSIADQVGLALENARLLADTRRRAGQLATLHRVGLDITSALDLDGVLQALYEQTCRIVDVSLFSVALYDPEAETMEYPLVMGVDGPHQVPTPEDRERRGLSAGALGLAAYVIEQGQPVRIPDLLDPPAELKNWPLWPAEQATRAYAGIPLVFREQVFGVLSVHSSRPGAYSQEDLDLLATMTTQASIAIQNARAYRQLMDTAEQLREVDRLKTQFLANMSHELRTPLNSIIGFSRVMLKGIDGPLTNLQEADLSSIHNSGQHLLALLNSILDMSKIEAGKMDLAFEEVRLSQILDTVVSTTRALIKDRPIELGVQVPPDLPTVWADPQRVRQILINLLSNAAKYTEKGQITLTAQVEGRPGGFVVVSVADSGVGIDPHAQQRLFIPFQQVDASTTRRAGGTGLGLAISRSFVEMHGGEIWVESQPGQGSTFHFTLPVHHVHPGEPVSEGQVPVAEAQAQLAPDKDVVLAVDDDPGVITILKRYLESDGYQVVGLLDSSAALEVARSLAARPKGQGALVAITLDVLMSRLDGWQVLDALKADPATAGIPVILCSIMEGLERGLSMGAAAFVQKPVTRDELLAILHRVRA
jgi:signal transduction histidine kinase/CheY-like chemotaxis protein/HAMP domain-containing protein